LFFKRRTVNRINLLKRTRYKVTTIHERRYSPTGKRKYSVIVKPEKAAKILQPDFSLLKKIISKG